MGVYQFWLVVLLFSIMAIFTGQGSVSPEIGVANGSIPRVGFSSAELLEGTEYHYALEKQAALPSRNAPRLNPLRGSSVLSERASTGGEGSRGSMWFTLGYAADLVLAAVLIPVLLRCYLRAVQSRGGDRHESNLLYRFIHTR